MRDPGREIAFELRTVSSFMRVRQRIVCFAYRFRSAAKKAKWRFHDAGTIEGRGEAVSVICSAIAAGLIWRRLPQKRFRSAM